jgi:hypothetical protein
MTDSSFQNDAFKKDEESQNYLPLGPPTSPMEERGFSVPIVGLENYVV